MRRLHIAVALFGNVALAFPASACATYSASEISNALQNCSSANDTLKQNSCNFGAAALAESGGNTCASNGNNYGVLQLTRSNLPAGMTPDQYLGLSMQDQVCIWAQQVGNSNTRGGYQTLANSTHINGTPVTAGMLMACFQFGPVICQNDIAYMNANGGACPTASSGGIRATRATLANRTANLDGNNQSICSWGGAIQEKINKFAAACKANGGGAGGTNCPGGSTTPDGAIPPSPADAPLQLPSNVG